MVDLMIGLNAVEQHTNLHLSLFKLTLSSPQLFKSTHPSLFYNHNHSQDLVGQKAQSSLIAYGELQTPEARDSSFLSLFSKRKDSPGLTLLKRKRQNQ